MQPTVAGVLRVQIYADVSCPWCRLGRHRFGRAAAELRDVVTVQAEHRPFQLDPDEPEQPRPVRASLGQKYGADKVDRMFSQMTALGQQEGLVFNLEPALSVNTVKAHQVLWIAGRDHDLAVQSTLAGLLFDAFFQHGLNVADHDVLVRLAAQAGMDAARVAAALQTGDAREEVLAAAKLARARGVTSVPTFVFPDGEAISGSRDVPAMVDLLRSHAASASH